MKKIITFIAFTLLSFGSIAQNLLGAWENYSTSAAGDSIRSVVIFTERYQVLSVYNASTGAFIHTNGGSWQLDGNMMTEQVEFHSDNPALVGTEVSFEIRFDDNSLEIVGSEAPFSKINAEKQHDLVGAWLMTGRVSDGNMQVRDSSGSRKTMKMLSGSRFQWIAYDTETKQFIATGGGSSSSINGVYTEKIEFFSRDNSKVGLQLNFDYELIDGSWHHTGNSSKGDPIHEIWSLRQ